MPNFKRLNILYVTQFFSPETVAASFRATENSRFWSQSGAGVTVFTAYPNYPEGHINSEYLNKHGMLIEVEGAIRIIRNQIIARPNVGFLNKGMSALSFQLSSLWNSVIHRRALGNDIDVVVVTSGTVFAALAGRRIAKSVNAPYVFELRDITYRQLVGTGAKENSFKVRLFKKWELGLCRDAIKIVTVTNGLKAVLISDGVPSNKIEVIPNGVDRLPMAPLEKDNGNGLVFGYFGSIGYSQNLSLVLDYLSQLNGHNRLVFHIIGSGADKPNIKKAVAESYDFANVGEQQHQNDLIPIENQCDFCIVSLLKDPEFSTALPSKLFRIMARGIPVLFVGPPGEASQLIEEYKTGICLTGTREEDIEKLISFFQDPNWRIKVTDMARRGRQITYEKYDRKKLSERYLELMEKSLQEAASREGD